MEIWRQRLKSRKLWCLLWVALCFGLTSAIYLSWLERLVALTEGVAPEWLSLVAGYLFQAAGMGAVALLLKRDPGADRQRAFSMAALLLAAMAVPALLSRFPAGAAAFGLLMNLMCGVIAGFYLYGIGRRIDAPHRAIVFGGGYALATVAVALLAIPGSGGLLRSGYALILYIPFAAGMALLASRLRLLNADKAEDNPSGAPESPDGKTLALACAAVLSISAVKNLGFNFPSSDVAAGLIPALTRLPYALGLAASGFVSDRSRKTGMACAVAALVLPFIMLGLSGESLPGAVCWGLDYLFYGFFSVFRAVLFMDLAERTRRWELAPMGLALSRVGDAAGTGAGLLLAGHRVLLIAVTALLFFPTMFLLFRLYQKLYEPQAVRQRSEREVFEAFCLHNDLSQREREVLRMVISERANGEIAEALFITESTVKYHVRNVLQKTGCKNRGELQRKYMATLYPGLRQPEKDSH